MKLSRGRAAAATVPGADPAGEVPLGFTAHLGPPRPTAAIGRRSRWRRHRTVLSTGVGLACALAGIALNAAPERVVVYVDAAGYHVGSSVLRAVGAGSYQSGGVVLVSRQLSGATEAASSMDLAGAHIVGSCHMGHTTEHCTFKMGDGRMLTAEDTLVVAGVQTWWQRQYSDRAGVRIDLQNGVAVPVPVLLGH